MSNGLTTDRLVTLRSRWNSDPTSRIFLQLAEEHRHLGQIREALAVLDRGLQEHPGYLSALVAKGRCHIELGEPEPARVVLERVVKQDATQMVANKLLVRAYLDTGDVARARERLDLYRLLNDSDPEIEVLRRRILAMDQPSKPTSPGPQPAREDIAPAAPAVFPDLAPPRREAPLDATDIFGIAPKEPKKEAPPLPPLWEPEGGPTLAFPLLPHLKAPAATSVQSAPPVHFEALPETSSAGSAARRSDLDVFPGLHADRSRDHYLAALASEGLFPVAAPRPAASPDVFDLPAPAAPDVFAPPVPEAPAGFEISVPAAPQVFEPDPSPFVFEPLEPVPSAPFVELEPFPYASFDAPAEPLPSFPPEPEPFALAAPEPSYFRTELEPEAPPETPPIEERFEEPGPDPAPISALATVTLAELYVGQGHPAEAEKLYREVLLREPDNAAARSGLDRLAGMERRLRPLEARDLLVDFQPVAVASGGETDTPRVRHVLLSYLQRLRERSPRDVS